MIQGWRRLRWVAISIAALGPLVVPGADLMVRAGVALAAVACTFQVVRWAKLRLDGDLNRLAHAVSEIGDGRGQQVVLPMAWPELKPLADAIEQSHGRARLQLRLLEQQREDLAMHLSRTEERLRDPTAEARRDRIARLADLTALLTVGDLSEPTALLDLSLDNAVLGVKPELAERLVPGMPVRLTLQVDGEPFEITRMEVLAPARGGLLDLREWIFRFEPPLPPSTLPSSLAKALELRRAERIRPLGSNPASATLVCELGRLNAEVVDISSTGLGIRTTLDAKRASRMGNMFTVQLHLPAMGEVAILDVVLRNMAVRTDGVRMGLSFDPDLDEAELEKVRTWLEVTRKALAA